MKTKSKLEHLPADIKSALIEKVLGSPDTYNDIAQWLFEVHGQKHSRSAIQRFAQAVKLMHGGLVDLGMQPTILATHASQLEKLGAYLVQRELLNLRISTLQKAIFSASGTEIDCL
ncbi:DUF3486 family protein [Methylomonas koyamae]|nr:DUF3486 family protein [Methylomonas koyamae]